MAATRRITYTSKGLPGRARRSTTVAALRAGAGSAPDATNARARSTSAGGTSSDSAIPRA